MMISYCTRLYRVVHEGLLWTLAYLISLDVHRVVSSVLPSKMHDEIAYYIALYTRYVAITMRVLLKFLSFDSVVTAMHAHASRDKSTPQEHTRCHRLHVTVRCYLKMHVDSV